MLLQEKAAVSTCSNVADAPDQQLFTAFLFAIHRQVIADMDVISDVMLMHLVFRDDASDRLAYMH